MHIWIIGHRCIIFGDGDFDKIWYIITEICTSTIEYQENDPEFDVQKFINETLGSKLSDKESIEAGMFYTGNKVIFDSVLSIYDNIADCKLVTSAINSMYYGNYFKEEYNKVLNDFNNDLWECYW